MSQYIWFNKVLQTKISQIFTKIVKSDLNKNDHFAYKSIVLNPCCKLLIFQKESNPKDGIPICLSNLQSIIINQEVQYTNRTLPESSLKCIKTQFTHSHDQSASWQG
jgi:hypothetical protein